MKTKLLLLLAALFFVCGVANAQKYTITESGWGRLEKGYKTGGNAPYEISLSEIDIHRWRRSKGELVLDEGEKLLSIRLPRKKISYNLLTESYVHKDRTGWSYVERQALCRFVSNAGKSAELLDQTIDLFAVIIHLGFFLLDACR